MNVNTGGVRSAVHVTVLSAVDVLPAASLAVNVLVCDLGQVPVAVPSLWVTVGVLQLSVADAEPSAAFISDADGLHPSVNVVPVALITGGVASNEETTPSISNPIIAGEVFLSRRNVPLPLVAP